MNTKYINLSFGSTKDALLTPEEIEEISTRIAKRVTNEVKEQLGEALAKEELAAK